MSAQPAPVPRPQPDLAARVAALRAMLTDAIDKAGMRNDPYQPVLQVTLSLAGLLAEATENLDQNRALITPEERRTFIAQTARQTAVAMVAHAGQVVSAAKWQAWALISGMLLTALLTGFGGGYWFGYADGNAAGASMGLQANGVIGQMPFAEGIAWEAIIAANPAIASSLAECRRTARLQDGRAACSLPIWVEQPKAPQ